MADDREKSIEAGMSDHVSKPIDPMQLYQTLEKWIGRRTREIPWEKARDEQMGKRPAVKDAAELPKLDGINVEAGLKRLLGNTKVYRRILLRFRRDFHDTAQAIKDLASQEKIDEVSRLAHSVKGVSGNIGAESFQAAAAALEGWFKDGGRGVPQREYVRFSEELGRVLNSLSVLETKEPSVTAREETAGISPELAKEFSDRLRNAAEMGDVTELSHIASDLSRMPGAAAELAEKVNTLIESFDFEALAKLADAIERG